MNLDWAEMRNEAGRIATTPEGHLWIAVLLSAVNDARRATPDPEAIAWIFSDTPRPLGFLWLCDMLDQPPHKIRDAVRASITPERDDADMDRLLKSMFRPVPTPFTLEIAQTTLRKLWHPRQVHRAINKAVKLGVLIRGGTRDTPTYHMPTKPPKVRGHDPAKNLDWIPEGPFDAGDLKHHVAGLTELSANARIRNSIAAWLREGLIEPLSGQKGVYRAVKRA